MLVKKVIAWGNLMFWSGAIGGFSRAAVAAFECGLTRGHALWELCPGLAADDLSGHETGRGQVSRPGAV